MRAERLAVSVIMTLGLASTGRAQQRPLTSALMGAGYAAGGAVIGAAIAARIPCSSTGESCNTKDVAGALAGAAVLGAFGAHAGNRFHGSLAADVGVGLAAAGAALAWRNGSNDNVLIPAAALGLAGLVLTEHATSHGGPRVPSRQEIAAIPAARLHSEIHPKYASLYGLGGGLLGAFGGTIAGAYIGYRIAYPRDIARGCEDCGLGGTLAGAFLGVVTGAIAGGIIGGHAGHRADREEAAARILGRGDER